MAAPALPKTQTAVIQSAQSAATPGGIAIAVSHDVALPDLASHSPHHVLVRVHACALNPTDHKMVKHFFMPGNTIGCDFSGVVVAAGAAAATKWPVGTRIAGADFPYRQPCDGGAFAQYALADGRQALRVPDAWSDAQAAALGAIGWGTVAMAVSDPEALALPGLPSHPAEKALPVLVYGAATATGVMAVQMLRLSGYRPIGVCSAASAARVRSLGAVGTAAYTSAVEVIANEVRALADGVPIRHALDCITDAASAAVCFAALGRAGGRYACLEEFSDQWHTRRAVRVKVVMGFEMMGEDVELGHAVYSRKASADRHALGVTWAGEIQRLLDQGLLSTQTVREVPGGFQGVLTAMDMCKSGEIRGEKLVVGVV